MISFGVCGSDIVRGVACPKFPSSRAWPCPPLTLGSAQGNFSHSSQRRGLGEGCRGGSSTLRWRASSPSARLSPPRANVKVCRYRVLASPRKAPLHSADSGSLLENVSSPAPTCRTRTHLGLLLTGTHDATAACLGKALRRATLKSSPPSQARDSLKLILAKPPLQVAANDGFSQPNAIFTRRYPEITSSLERANCHFSCRGKSRRST